jgi:hypothetical protein
MSAGKQKRTNAKIIQTQATMATGRENLPRYHGPGRKRAEPQTMRAKMGIPYATYGPRMARAKIALGVSFGKRWR